MSDAKPDPATGQAVASNRQLAHLQSPWQPGYKGGPGGRSLSVGKALSLARRWSPHAVQLCGKTIVDESAPLSLRLRAAETILAVAVPKATPDRASVLRELLEITFVDAPQHPHAFQPPIIQGTAQPREEERPRASMDAADVVPDAVTDLDGLAPPSIAANDDQSGQ